MDFRITEEHRRLQERCKHLAADFATRAAARDRDPSHPPEHCEILRIEGFYALNAPTDLGGSGAAMQFPPSDFCLSNIGLLELGLDAEALLPPLK